MMSPKPSGVLKRLWALPGMAWGFGGGLIASLCWFGPALAVLLGMSGALFFLGNLNSWYYYILGGLFLAVGIYYQYRRQSVSASLAWRRRIRWLFPLVTITAGGAAYLLISFIITPLLISSGTKPTLLPQTGLPVNGTAYTKSASLRLAELHIEGMTWYSCATDVERAAGLQSGVKHMEVHYPEGDAVLVYDGNRTTPERVVKALQDKFPEMEIVIRTDRPFQ